MNQPGIPFRQVPIIVNDEIPQPDDQQAAIDLTDDENESSGDDDDSPLKLLRQKRPDKSNFLKMPENK